MDICIDCLNEPCSCDKIASRVSRRSHPDSLTNDYVYVRGEWDYLKKSREEVIDRESRLYRLHIEHTRRSLGLTDAA